MEFLYENNVCCGLSLKHHAVLASNIEDSRRTFYGMISTSWKEMKETHWCLVFLGVFASLEFIILLPQSLMIFFNKTIVEVILESKMI